MKEYPNQPAGRWNTMTQEGRAERHAAYAAAGFQWTARCNCYRGHASASGRCQMRDIFYPKDGPEVCAYCAANCHPK